MQMLCQISPRRTCNPCGNTMKISLRYHRLLIYDVKRTTKIDGMGPFNVFYSGVIYEWDGKSWLENGPMKHHIEHINGMVLTCVKHYVQLLFITLKGPIPSF